MPKQLALTRVELRKTCRKCADHHKKSTLFFHLSPISYRDLAAIYARDALAFRIFSYKHTLKGGVK